MAVFQQGGEVLAAHHYFSSVRLLPAIALLIALQAPAQQKAPDLHLAGMQLIEASHATEMGWAMLTWGGFLAALAYQNSDLMFAVGAATAATGITFHLISAKHQRKAGRYLMGL